MSECTASNGRVGIGETGYTQIKHEWGQFPFHIQLERNTAM